MVNQPRFSIGDQVHLVAGDVPGWDCAGICAWGPFEVRSITIKINTNFEGKEFQRTEYSLNGGVDGPSNRSEENLFSSVEEARTEADRRHNARLKRQMR